ncbi:PLP-dependent aminotransferase family protein [Alkalicella caledoniensis]|uniref:PLP-dependent aminotransferase family protein n=1 Tax=Alkalicella caledoniensis TaxID=2731377 RepID=A0A7G9WC35_ALKCA|nr:PLP-dependent aminotransferase family protein [Alkalicella caledoniensis]QNO16247.1 PLP-dependent aminotransferase family protein [Alkalicella caledoniensis]
MNVFHVQFTNSESKYKQLTDHIKSLIVKGSLPHHYKLPSIRKLSTFLNVNNVTIVNCYKTLEQDGYAYTIHGSGTFVIADNNLIDTNEGYSESTVFGDVKYDFITSSPSPTFFPVKAFKGLLNDVLERDGGFAFNYQEAGGYLPLRQSLRELLKGYKINVPHQYVHIISGGQQGLDIIAKTLLSEGDFVFTEEPCYPGAMATFSSRGAKTVGIPVRNKGMDLQILEDRLKKFNPKFIYVMPDFQSPTGYQYDLAHRRKLLDLASKYNTLIVEDDHFSDLNYSINKIPPLKALDTENIVIYIKSFSKVFMPGLRLALLVAPPIFNTPLIEAKQFSDISTSGFLQRAFDLYLRKDLWQEHVNKVKKVYQSRCLTTISALEKRLPSSVMFTKPTGGLCVWIQLPPHICADDIANLAKQHGVGILPGDDFFIDRKQNFFRLSFTTMAEKDIEAGIEILASIIKGTLK